MKVPPKDKLVQLPFRLALRDEGEFWVAYFADEPEPGENPHDLHGATILGTIRMSLIRGPDNKARMEAFKALMVEAMGHAITKVTNVKPEFEERKVKKNGTPPTAG